MYRVAPEQVRFATSEERTLLNTPQADLLGIKDLIEGGAFKAQQYVDLVSQSYPPPAQSDKSVELRSIDEPDGPASEPVEPASTPAAVQPPPLVTSVSPPSVPESSQPEAGVVNDTPSTGTQLSTRSTDGPRRNNFIQ